jgi:hypothetical protein
MLSELSRGVRVWWRVWELEAESVVGVGEVIVWEVQEFTVYCK